MSARLHNCPRCGPMIQESPDSICCPGCGEGPAQEGWAAALKSSEEPASRVRRAEPELSRSEQDDHKSSISPSPLPEGLDLAELKRVAEAVIADPKSDCWPNWQYSSRVGPRTILRLLSELQTARGERDEALCRREHTAQWYAERLEPIKDVAKRVGVWPEVAAIIANGSGTRQLPDGSYKYEPPTYAQQLNIAKYRAEKAEANLSRALEALGPFAKIKPSSFYPGDGSEAEEYIVLLRDRYANPRDFTGADLARASEVFTTLSEEEKEGSYSADRAAPLPSEAGWSAAQHSAGERGSATWIAAAIMSTVSTQPGSIITLRRELAILAASCLEGFDTTYPAENDAHSPSAASTGNLPPDEPLTPLTSESGE